MEERSKKLLEQVSGKIHLGDSESEVRAWLQAKKNISGAVADEFIAFGLKEKRSAIRRRAIVRIVASAFGLLLFVGFQLLQYQGGFVVIGLGVILIWGFAITAAGVFLHSLWELLTGKSERPF